jgi:hypothetical protein
MLKKLLGQFLVQGLLLNKFTIPIAVVTGLLAPSAFAADMAIKAPPSAPVPTGFTWNGCHVGAMVVAAWAETITNLATLLITLTLILRVSKGLITGTIQAAGSLAFNMAAMLNGPIGWIVARLAGDGGSGCARSIIDITSYIAPRSTCQPASAFAESSD